MGLITEETDESGRGSIGLGRRARVDSEEAEITLGMRSLLGIFFGLVLICGIFFGLGYSVGRSGGARVASDENPSANPTTNANLKKPSAEQGLTPVPEPTPTALEKTSPTSNPPAATQQAETPAPAASESKAPAVTNPTPAPAPKAAAAAAQPASAPARPQVAQATQPPTPPARPQTLTTQQPTSSAPPQLQSVAAAAPPSSFMVQIAAVRLPTDANVLMTALNRRGYHAVVRNEPTDALLHVQVGPFTSRGDANNMRAKLLADGYNAVVK